MHWMIQRLYENFQPENKRTCLHVENNSYSYADIYERVKSIRKILSEKTKQDFIGIVSENSEDTYASILACWFSGKGFVPIHPRNPVERNEKILEQAKIDLVLASSAEYKNCLPKTKNLAIVQTDDLQKIKKPLQVKEIPETTVFCVLFTSGSTGQPKGVPLTLKNIACTLDAFFSLGYNLTENDRFLQMFEFTFDLAMMSFLPAFYLGASVYTVGYNKIRYLEALRTLQDHKISFAIMVPSTLTLLQSYFSKIQLPELKYALIGGEPFPFDLAKSWSGCVSNAAIINVYAPAEATMLCMGYTYDRNVEKNKAHNGILAFGKPWKNTTALVIDENIEIVVEGQTGELCFSGDHVMQGYLDQPDLNKEVFFQKEIHGNRLRFYRTGDMVYFKDGIYYTCGRKDLQVKIQGHRIELEEIECIARKVLINPQVFALAGLSKKGTTEIYLVIASEKNNEAFVRDKLQSKLPPYMIPNSIKFVDKLVYNDHGKIDRKALKKLFE